MRSSIAECGLLSRISVRNPYAQEAEADDEQPRHRAGAEGDVERGLEALLRGFGRPHVRAHGDVHADEAGCSREEGADQEPDRGAPAELVVEADQEERHDRDEADRHVLPAQVGGRAFLHGVRDLAHPLGAGGPVQQPHGQPDPVGDGDRCADQGEQNRVFFEDVQRRASQRLRRAEFPGAAEVSNTRSLCGTS